MEADGRGRVPMKGRTCPANTCNTKLRVVPMTGVVFYLCFQGHQTSLVLLSFAAFNVIEHYLCCVVRINAGFTVDY